MKTITTIEELMQVLEETSGNFGLRGATEHDVEIADRGYLDCSFDNWDGSYDYENEEKLSGTSAVCVTEYMSNSELQKRYNVAKSYATWTDVVYLVSDENCELGSDDGEVVLGHNGYGADIIALVNLG